eukprot:12226326-Alexandrium_andersonii.AAC.1
MQDGDSHATPRHMVPRGRHALDYRLYTRGYEELANHLVAQYDGHDAKLNCHVLKVRCATR